MIDGNVSFYQRNRFVLPTEPFCSTEGNFSFYRKKKIIRYTDGNVSFYIPPLMLISMDGNVAFYQRQHLARPTDGAGGANSTGTGNVHLAGGAVFALQQALRGYTGLSSQPQGAAVPLPAPGKPAVTLQLGPALTINWLILHTLPLLLSISS